VFFELSLATAAVFSNTQSQSSDVASDVLDIMPLAGRTMSQHRC